MAPPGLVTLPPTMHSWVAPQFGAGFCNPTGPDAYQLHVVGDKVQFLPIGAPVPAGAKNPTPLELGFTGTMRSGWHLCTGRPGEGESWPATRPAANEPFQVPIYALPKKAVTDRAKELLAGKAECREQEEMNFVPLPGHRFSEAGALSFLDLLGLGKDSRRAEYCVEKGGKKGEEDYLLRLNFPRAFGDQRVKGALRDLTGLSDEGLVKTAEKTELAEGDFPHPVPFFGDNLGAIVHGLRQLVKSDLERQKAQEDARAEAADARKDQKVDYFPWTMSLLPLGYLVWLLPDAWTSDEEGNSLLPEWKGDKTWLTVTASVVPMVLLFGSTMNPTLKKLIRRYFALHTAPYRLVWGALVAARQKDTEPLKEAQKALAKDLALSLRQRHMQTLDKMTVDMTEEARKFAEAFEERLKIERQRHSGPDAEDRARGAARAALRAKYPDYVKADEMLHSIELGLKSSDPAERQAAADLLKSIEQAEETLVRANNSNPVLEAPKGTGKSTLMHAIVLRSSRGESSVAREEFQRRHWRAITRSGLMGTGEGDAAKFVGNLETNVRELIEALKYFQKHGEAVALPADEIHSFFAGAQTDPHVARALQLLKGEMASNNIVGFLGASTPEEMGEARRADSAMSSRLPAVHVSATGEPMMRLAVMARLYTVSPELFSQDWIHETIQALIKASYQMEGEYNPRAVLDQALPAILKGGSFDETAIEGYFETERERRVEKIASEVAKSFKGRFVEAALLNDLGDARSSPSISRQEVARAIMEVARKEGWMTLVEAEGNRVTTAAMRQISELTGGGSIEGTGPSEAGAATPAGNGAPRGNGAQPPAAATPPDTRYRPLVQQVQTARGVTIDQSAVDRALEIVSPRDGDKEWAIAKKLGVFEGLLEGAAAQASSGQQVEPGHIDAAITAVGNILGEHNPEFSRSFQGASLHLRAEIAGDFWGEYAKHRRDGGSLPPTDYYVQHVLSRNGARVGPATPELPVAAAPGPTAAVDSEEAIRIELRDRFTTLTDPVYNGIVDVLARDILSTWEQGGRPSSGGSGVLAVLPPEEFIERGMEGALVKIGGRSRVAAETIRTSDKGRRDRRDTTRLEATLRQASEVAKR